MNRIIDDIREARSLGKLPMYFRVADVKKACPCRAENTYETFLPKHRVGNPGGDTELFKQHADGSYSLIA